MFVAERIGSKVILPPPNPKLVRFLSPENIPADLGRIMTDHFGSVRAIIGYGSGFNGTRTSSSRLDAIVVTDDILKFHQQNIPEHPEMYGLPHSIQYHAAWDKFGFTYYRFGLPVDGQEILMKMALISTPNLQEMASDGYRGELKVRKPNPFDLAVQHRLQKYALAQITPVDDVIRTAIVQARELGLATALSSLPRKTYLPLIRRQYVDTYRFDVRIESPNKVNSILNAHDQEYNQMLAALLEQFEMQGLARKLGEGKYERLFTPDKVSLKTMAFEAKGAAIFSNYVKGLLTGGIVSGLIYANQKRVRSSPEIID